MESLLEWIGLTSILLAVVVCIIGCKSWDLGRDYIIKDNFGKRLNLFEKFCDGLKTFFKM